MINYEKLSKDARKFVCFLTEREPGSIEIYKPVIEENFNKADKVTLDEILNLIYVALDYISSTPEPEDYEDEHISPHIIEQACKYYNDLVITVKNVGSGLELEIPKISEAKKPYIIEAAHYMLEEVKEQIRSYDDE
jgi:hypothetical protein